MLPVVLTVSGRWQALASAGIAAGFLAAAAWVAFGAEAWRAFRAALWQGADAALITHQLPWAKVQSVYGLARDLGAGAGVAGAAYAAVSLVVTGATCALWRSRTTYALKAAAAAGAALVVMPYLFAYDLAAIVVAAAFIARDRTGRLSVP